MKMKDKKAEQIKNKKRHLEELKSTRASISLARREPTKLERPLILIVCEGRNTEKSYFDKFRLTSAQLITLGKGYNTVTLVNEAIRLSKLNNYDQVWCVFDKDDFSANDFNNAIAMAEANAFRVAHSNQAFEYWLLLHFEDHQGGALPRQDYNNKINSYTVPLGVTYDGNGSKLISNQMFELMESNMPGSNESRRDIAIKRARRNFDRFDHISPATEESSTKIFLLVEEILKYL